MPKRISFVSLVFGLLGVALLPSSAEAFVCKYAQIDTAPQHEFCTIVFEDDLSDRGNRLICAAICNDNFGIENCEPDDDFRTCGEGAWVPADAEARTFNATNRWYAGNDPVQSFKLELFNSSHPRHQICSDKVMSESRTDVTQTDCEFDVREGEWNSNRCRGNYEACLRGEQTERPQIQFPKLPKQDELAKEKAVAACEMVLGACMTDNEGVGLNAINIAENQRKCEESDAYKQCLQKAIPPGCYCHVFHPAGATIGQNQLIPGFDLPNTCADKSSENRVYTQCAWLGAPPTVGGTSSGASTATDANSFVLPDTSALNQFAGVPGAGIERIQIIIGRTLRIVTGILGSIALLILVYAGVLWMTSLGNAERARKALDTIFWAAVGIFVILGGYSVLQFIFTHAF